MSGPAQALRVLVLAYLLRNINAESRKDYIMLGQVTGIMSVSVSVALLLLQFYAHSTRHPFAAAKRFDGFNQDLTG